MNTKLTKNDAIKVDEMLAAFNAAEKENSTLEQNMVDFYLAQFPGTFPEDAHDIVNRIKTGVSTFNSTLNEAIASNGADYVEKLKTLGEGKTNEEKYEIYINFLATLTVLDASNLSGENNEFIESFEEIKSKIYTVKETVSEEELEAIIVKVADALNNTTFTMSSAEMVNQLLDKLPEGETGMKEVIRGSEEDVKSKMVASLVTYICHQKGELSSAGDTELTVEQITINVCTGIEESRILADVKKGILTVDNAIRLIKILGGVAIFTMLATTIFVPFAATAGFAITKLLVLLFGSSEIALISALVVGITVSLGMTLIVGRYIIPDVMDWSGNQFDKTIKAWRETAWPNIKGRINALMSWIDDLKNKNVVVGATTPNINNTEQLINATV